MTPCFPIGNPGAEPALRLRLEYPSPCKALHGDSLKGVQLGLREVKDIFLEEQLFHIGFSVIFTYLYLRPDYPESYQYTADPTADEYPTQDYVLPDEEFGPEYPVKLVGGKDCGSDILVMPSPEASAFFCPEYPDNQLGLEDSASPKATELVP